MITDLNELIRLCKDELHDREYHAHHASILTSEWEAVSQWFQKCGIHLFDRSSAFAYCDEVIGSHIITDGMSFSQKKRLRAVRMLLSYQETGDFEFRSPRVEYVFTENTGDRIQKYLRHEEEKGRSESTIRCKKSALYRFNKYLVEKELDFSDLGIQMMDVM